MGLAFFAYLRYVVDEHPTTNDMAKIQKFPYDKQEHGWFSSSWRSYTGRAGCAIIYGRNKQTAVQMERVPSGATPPKPDAKPNGATSSTAGAASAASGAGESKPDIPKILGVECKQPPPFDMLDLPDAMDKEKFHVAAKLAREWFSGRAYVYDNKPDGPQPIIDTSTVTLEWALRYGKAKEHFKKLYKEDVYSENALKVLREGLNKPIFC